MIRLLALLVLLAGLAGALTAASVEVENSNVASADLAPALPERTPFSARITVRNPHDRAVKVDRLDASCSCMQLTLAAHFLLPHEATTLDIAVDDTNRSGPQRMGVSVYFTDSELEPVEVQCWWSVIPDIAVDALAPRAESTARPADIAWRDVYKFVAHERPDELNRLNKRIRLESPADVRPAGGLEILGLDYDGPVWRFTPLKQADGSWLITATAKDLNTPLAEKTWDETLTIRTNHPQKPVVKIQMIAVISKKAGSENLDPFAIPQPPLMPPGP